MIMKHVVWLVTAALMFGAAATFASDSDRLMRRANRYFAPLPAAMPGSESDTPARIELGPIEHSNSLAMDW